MKNLTQNLLKKDNSSILTIELKKDNNKSMKISKKAFLLVVLILLSTLYSVNFMRNAQEIYTTGDLSFHLSRIKGLSSIFEGPINYTTFNNYGDGLNYFYPFLTIIPAVVFYGISNNLILSYVLYIWLLNICTILISFYYGEKFFKKIDAAFLFSCLYTFATYRTVDIYYRSAIAEAIALTIIPAVLYYAYGLIFNREKKVIALSVSISLLVYTHVLTTLLCSALIACMIIVRLFLSKQIKNDIKFVVVNLVKAVFLTCALTSYFWYPMLQQMNYQEIHSPFKTDLQLEALSISDSIIQALNNDITTYTMGLLGLVALIFPLFILKEMEKKEKIIYVGVVSTWVCVTNLFPWFLFQKTPISLLQFPWRILGIQIFFSSMIITLVFMKKTMNKKYSWLIIGATVVFLLVTSIAAKENYAKVIQSKHGHIVINEETLPRYTTSDMGGLYDYAPTEAIKERPHLEKHEVKVGESWEKGKYKAADNNITYTVASNKKQKVTVPVYAYLGTQVKVNGKVVNDSYKKHGLVNVDVNAGENKIEITTKYTPTALMALWISILTYCLVVYSSFKRFAPNKLKDSRYVTKKEINKKNENK